MGHRGDRSGRARAGRTAVLLAGLAVVLALVLTGCGDDPDDVGTDDADGSTTTTDASPSDDTTSTTGASATSAGELEGRTFESTEVSGDHQLVEGSTIRLVFEDGRIAVDAGCNQMSGTVTVEGGSLRVGAFMSTMMGCEPALMDQDTWVAAFFEAGPTYTLDGGTLELVADGATIVFEEEEPAPDAELAGPTWTAESIVSDDAVSTVAGDPPTFVFADDGTVAIFDGCNQGSAGYEVDGDVITFQAPAATLMACPEETAQAWADAVAGVLLAPATFTIEGDVLRLRADDGSGLDLRAG